MSIFFKYNRTYLWMIRPPKVVRLLLIIRSRPLLNGQSQNS